VATLTTQRPGKKISLLGVGILLVGGCIPGYQDTPIPPCFFANDPDPACQSGQGHDGSGTGGGVPTTGTAFPGDGSSAEDSEGQGPGDGTDTSEVDAETTRASGSESTGPAVEPEPEIVDLDLDPDAPKSAGPVKVTVQAENAVEVWMKVDDGGEVALEPVGDEGTEFVGEIAVLGESWNGLHTVSAVARAGELESLPWEAMFTVTAPAAGTEAWKKMSSITPSFGNAVAVDAQGDVYELITDVGQSGCACHVRRRDAQGEPVWPQESVQLAVGTPCVGEEIEVGPDGCVGAGQHRRGGCRSLAAFPSRVRTGRCWTTLRSAVSRSWARARRERGGRRAPVRDTPRGRLPDAWVKLPPVVGGDGRCPGSTSSATKSSTSATKDCAFVEDRIVVVGEAFGKHDPEQPWNTSRGFVVELGVNGVKLAEDVATDFLRCRAGTRPSRRTVLGGMWPSAIPATLRRSPATRRWAS
jgi:hypothetical protein